MRRTQLRRGVVPQLWSTSRRCSERLDELQRYGRPLLCTEWLARHHGSKFDSHLPLFRERNVGIYQWGLVAGRTQTYLHWYTRYSPEPETEPRLWLHDVMRPDGEPVRPGRGRRAARPRGPGLGAGAGADDPTS